MSYVLQLNPIVLKFGETRETRFSLCSLIVGLELNKFKSASVVRYVLQLSPIVLKFGETRETRFSLCSLVAGLELNRFKSKLVVPYNPLVINSNLNDIAFVYAKGISPQVTFSLSSSITFKRIIRFNLGQLVLRFNEFRPTYLQLCPSVFELGINSINIYRRLQLSTLNLSLPTKTSLTYSGNLIYRLRQLIVFPPITLRRGKYIRFIRRRSNLFFFINLRYKKKFSLSTLSLSLSVLPHHTIRVFSPQLSLSLSASISEFKYNRIFALNPLFINTNFVQSDFSKLSGKHLIISQLPLFVRLENVVLHRKFFLNLSAKSLNIIAANNLNLLLKHRILIIRPIAFTYFSDVGFKIKLPINVLNLTLNYVKPQFKVIFPINVKYFGIWSRISFIKLPQFKLSLNTKYLGLAKQISLRANRKLQVSFPAFFITSFKQITFKRNRLISLNNILLQTNNYIYSLAKARSLVVSILPISTSYVPISLLHHRSLALFNYWFGKGRLSLTINSINFALNRGIIIQPLAANLAFNSIELSNKLINSYKPTLNLQPISFLLGRGLLVKALNNSLAFASISFIRKYAINTLGLTVSWSVRLLRTIKFEISSLTIGVHAQEIRFIRSLIYKLNVLQLNAPQTTLATLAQATARVPVYALVLTGSMRLLWHRRYDFSDPTLYITGFVGFKRNYVFKLNSLNLNLTPQSIQLKQTKGIAVQILTLSTQYSSKLLKNTRFGINFIGLSASTSISYLRNRIFKLDLPLNLGLSFGTANTKIAQLLKVSSLYLSLSGHSSLLKNTKFSLSNLLINTGSSINFLHNRIFNIGSINLQTSIPNQTISLGKILKINTLHLSLPINTKTYTHRIMKLSELTLYLLTKKPMSYSLPQELKCWFHNENRFYSIYEFYGVFVALLRNYFASINNRLDNSLVDELVWPTNLRIELAPGLVDKVSGNLPAIFISRSPLQQQRIGIGDRYIKENELAKPAHSVFFVGETIISVITYEYNQALLLASEIINLLQYYRRILAKYLDIRFLFHPNIKGIKSISVQGGNAFVVQISVRYIQKFSAEIQI